jgi:hypothetical protein
VLCSIDFFLRSVVNVKTANAAHIYETTPSFDRLSLSLLTTSLSSSLSRHFSLFHFFISLSQTNGERDVHAHGHSRKSAFE